MLCVCTSLRSYEVHIYATTRNKSGNAGNNYWRKMMKKEITITKLTYKNGKLSFDYWANVSILVFYVVDIIVMPDISAKHSHEHFCLDRLHCLGECSVSMSALECHTRHTWGSLHIYWKLLQIQANTEISITHKWLGLWKDMTHM